MALDGLQFSSFWPQATEMVLLLAWLHILGYRLSLHILSTAFILTVIWSFNCLLFIECIIIAYELAEKQQCVKQAGNENMLPRFTIFDYWRVKKIYSTNIDNWRRNYPWQWNTTVIMWLLVSCHNIKVCQNLKLHRKSIYWYLFKAKLMIESALQCQCS